MRATYMYLLTIFFYIPIFILLRMTLSLYLDDIKKEHVLKKIEVPVPPPETEPGYMYIVVEAQASNNVCLGVIKDIHASKVLQSLQRGNPRKLKMLRTFLRSNYRDAANICSFFRDALILSQGMGNWYSINPVVVERMLDEMFDTL